MKIIVTQRTHNTNQLASSRHPNRLVAMSLGVFGAFRLLVRSRAGLANSMPVDPALCLHRLLQSSVLRSRLFSSEADRYPIPSTQKSQPGREAARCDDKAILETKDDLQLARQEEEDEEFEEGFEDDEYDTDEPGLLEGDEEAEDEAFFAEEEKAGEAAVMGKAEAAKSRTMIRLNEDDLEEQFVRGSGNGGQKINKTNNCVILLHKPTGLQVKCQQTRSLQLNRIMARKRLTAKVDEKVNGALSKRVQKGLRRKRNQDRRYLRSKKKAEQALAEGDESSDSGNLNPGPLGTSSFEKDTAGDQQQTKPEASESKQQPQNNGFQIVSQGNKKKQFVLNQTANQPVAQVLERNRS